MTSVSTANPSYCGIHFFRPHFFCFDFIQVKVGDTLDLVLSENQENNTVTVMRVAPRRVSGETTTTEKYRVVLRRWKYLELSRDEALKS